MSDETKVADVPVKFTGIVDAIERLSVLDLAELVKVLEEKFGVSAAAPVLMASAGAAVAVEEKTSFNVELTVTGTNKIGIIKVVREVTGLGLKEAKDIADAPPKIIKEGADKATAEEIKKKIEDAGGKANLI
ncbi:MAG: 50S ribosomal protein L7/L12 [Patescibacteria group bacterium]